MDFKKWLGQWVNTPLCPLVRNFRGIHQFFFLDCTTWTFFFPRWTSKSRTQVSLIKECCLFELLQIRPLNGRLLFNQLSRLRRLPEWLILWLASLLRDRMQEETPFLLADAYVWLGKDDWHQKMLSSEKQAPLFRKDKSKIKDDFVTLNS